MNLGRTRSVHITSKKHVSFDYIDPSKDVDYPSTWFEKNPDEKPKIILPEYQGGVEDLLHSVKGGIRSASLSIETVKVFLHEYGLSMRTMCREDWVSFGITIGTEGTEVSPWDIVEVVQDGFHTPTEPMYTAPPQGAVPASDDPFYWTEKAMVLYILSIYRLAKITNDDYAEVLQKRMEDQTAAEGGKGISFHGVRSLYSSWLSDRDFLKMVAAYDMFLHYFKDHNSSILRMGSLGSRFRDCAGLLSMGYALSILNTSAGELMDWVFIRKMGDEILQITKENQEIGNKYSYFPYQSDLGLVTKSAYSSNANPYLFFWLHIIGSILGHKRSQNARLNFEGNFADVGLNATIVAWVYAREGELTPQFQSEGHQYGDEIEFGVNTAEEESKMTPEDKVWIETQGRDASAWFAILKSQGFKIPTLVKSVIKRQREKIKDTREGTIGEYVKHNLLLLLLSQFKI